MKGFQFRFELVLNLRVDQEKKIKDELAKAIKELVELDALLVSAHEEKHTFYEHVNALMSSGVNAAELQSFEGNKRYLRDAIKRLHHMIQKKIPKLDTFA